MNVLPVRILLPHLKIRLYRDLFDAVQGHYVKLPDGFIVFRRISRGCDDPAFRHLMAAEGLALQKLQHGGSQGLGHTVDLIDKQNPLFKPRIPDPVVNRRHDLAHGILCYRIFLPSIDLMFNKRQTHGALSCMMSNGIGHQAQLTFPGNLLHDLCLSHSRRPDQKHRSLPDGGDHIFSAVIL